MPQDRPRVYSIPAHRGFADALVAGLVPRYRDKDAGLARLTLLLPSRRAVSAVAEAFTRHAGLEGAQGLLMPRMTTIGDADLTESLGHLFDPLTVTDIPPTVEPTRRWLVLADIIAEELGDEAPKGALRLRQARDYAQTIDRLLIERIAPNRLISEDVLDLVGGLQKHWLRALRNFLLVHDRWTGWLDEHGLVDIAEYRNRLFDHASARWRADGSPSPIVAAGITSPSPAIAGMLRTIAELGNGSVILPDLDMTLDDRVWAELGQAGRTDEAGQTPFGRSDAVTHPQYHLKLLLNRMGIAREEVRLWHRRGAGAADPDRSHAVSALFLPPQASRSWVDLPASKRRLAAVRIVQAANPEEEAQSIALLVREALDTPQKRVTVVTPDRGLARRVVQHLGRWGIAADDSAGVPLSQTPAGRLLLTLLDAIVSGGQPVELMAFLQHPFVHAQEGRREWLFHTRDLELALRGPRLATGLDTIALYLQTLFANGDRKVRGLTGLEDWWAGVAARLEPCRAFYAAEGPVRLADALAVLVDTAQDFCGNTLWAREDGRALSSFVDDLRMQAGRSDTMIAADDLPNVLFDAMECTAVRPPYGGHPRVSIYGLIEARLTRADLMICGGLNEGVWPQAPQSDGLLAPPIMRALGVPGSDYRIGLAAHDLASALGAKEVVLTRAARDESGPTIPSRFLLRVEALLGEQLDDHLDTETPLLAAALDSSAEEPARYPRPRPDPTPEQRDVSISATALDRLRGDPYQFYAGSILRLGELDPLDGQPSPAWQGSLAHDIIERWHRARGSDPAQSILPIAEIALAELQSHPLVITLWKPRLLAALEWIETQVRADEHTGREVVKWEVAGKMIRDGVTIHGRADRLDRLQDGTLAVVDYKTGRPPSSAMVEEGFALQLGLLGLIAEAGGFDGIPAADASVFEYWSLAKSAKSETGFGYIETPLKAGSKRSGIEPDRFLPEAARYLDDAIARWIKGREPFTAKLNPDYPGYDTYDQLMRLAEWQARDPSSDGDGR